MTLHEWMEKRGMTQAELALLLDVDQTSVSKWLRGRTPEIDSIIRIELLSGGEVPYFVWSSLVELDGAAA